MKQWSRCGIWLVALLLLVALAEDAAAKKKDYYQLLGVRACLFLWPLLIRHCERQGIKNRLRYSWQQRFSKTSDAAPTCPEVLLRDAR